MVPLLIALFALLVIVGGAYIYKNNQVGVPNISDQVQQVSSPSLVFLYPDAAALSKISKGQKIPIQWKTMGINQQAFTIDISLVDEKNISVLKIATALPASANIIEGYEWTIPATISDGRYRIEIDTSPTKQGLAISARSALFTLESINPTTANSWKVYSDSSLTFKYPPILSLIQNGGTVILDHSIAYKHYDFGDMKGTSLPLDRFTDFSLSFKVFNQNLKELVQSSAYPGWDYVSQNPFKLGSFSGYRVTEGVEGSGKDVYYFSISSNKTLVLERVLIPELTPIDGDYKTYLNLPGIILPNQAEDFFTKILLSLKVN